MVIKAPWDVVSLPARYKVEKSSIRDWTNYGGIGLFNWFFLIIYSK